MHKILKFIGLFFLILPLQAQENWFMAQTEKAEVSWISASSELVEAQYEGAYLYPPINILDGNFDTTWCEADEGGSGIGESIAIQLTEPVSFDEIQFVNGFASGNDFYHKNNRVAAVTLTQVAGKHYQQKQYNLEDNREEWQSITFEMPQTVQNLTITINNIFEGYKYNDTCFSDIRLLYKGEVIPFTNIETIRSVQEETSRKMLEETGSNFKELFYDLFTDNRLYLKSKDSSYGNGYLFEVWDTSSDSKNLTKNNISFNDPEADGTTNYEPSYERPVGCQLNKYTIISYQTIDYVETKTIMTLKLDGDKGLYINGAYYMIMDPDNLVYGGY